MLVVAAVCHAPWLLVEVDLDAFCAKIIDEIQEASHSRQRAARAKGEQRPPAH